MMTIPATFLWVCLEISFSPFSTLIDLILLGSIVFKNSFVISFPSIKYKTSVINCLFFYTFLLFNTRCFFVVHCWNVFTAIKTKARSRKIHLKDLINFIGLQKYNILFFQITAMKEIKELVKILYVFSNVIDG